MMLKLNLQQQYNQSLFIPLLLIIYLISSSFQQQKQPIYKTYKKLIFGKWIHKSKEVGDVVMVFYGDGSGLRRVDSNQTTYKFKYSLVKDSILKISVGAYKPELHVIKKLTAAALIIREYPFDKNRESISFFDTDYRRE
ncbi:hypothetical protein [Mucilaginibacter sp. CSA2-8R]|uniref:hypothetical protein n=1 Tax=Mucilaginibacter sp. CSA2-8R TaxID=3141542 RepID=UPI00315DA330